MTGLLRTEAVQILAAARGAALTVVTMRALPPWNALGQADTRNFNNTGCMGSAASVGLGLALARPSDQVIVVDGDGSLLMQLGSLVTISGCRPANLVHVVMENGVYETSGGQDLPGHGRGDLMQLALAAGYRSAERFDAAAPLREGIAAVLERPGPTFVSLVISGPGADEPPGHPAPAAKAVQIEQLRAGFAEQVLT
jgi:thiamine pyrophosphate-dependent acetolactate synthase large subunit-like protein